MSCPSPCAGTAPSRAQGPVSLGSGSGLRVFSLRGCRAVQDGCGAQVTGGEGGVAINADLRAGDVSALLTTASEQAFAEVPPDARLQDCPPGSPLYLAATCSMTCSAALASGRPSAPRCCTSSAHGSSRSMTATCTGYTRTEPPASLSKSMTPAPAGGRPPRRDLLDSADDFAWLADACRTDNSWPSRRSLTGKDPDL